MDSSKHLEIGMFDIIKSFDFIKNEKKLSMFKKVSENAVVFFILYMNDILLIRNDIFMLI